MHSLFCFLVVDHSDANIFCKSVLPFLLLSFRCICSYESRWTAMHQIINFSIDYASMKQQLTYFFSGELYEHIMKKSSCRTIYHHYFILFEKHIKKKYKEPLNIFFKLNNIIKKLLFYFYFKRGSFIHQSNTSHIFPFIYFQTLNLHPNTTPPNI